MYKYEVSFDDKIKLQGNQLVQVTGLSEMSTTYKTVKNANAVGEIIVGRNINSRDIFIKSKIHRKMANIIDRYFQPYKNYVLLVNGKKINCVCEKSIMEDINGIYNDPFLTLQLFCPDPYFYDISDFGKNIAGVQPLFGFPWRGCKPKGVNFGYRIYTEQTIFVNSGDEKVGLRVTVKAARGTAKNIGIENLRTGQFIKVNTSMLVGDMVEISSVKGKTPSQIYLKKNNADIFPQIDRGSDFFDLETGDNFLKFTADEGITNIDVTLYYTPIYKSALLEV